MKSAGRAANPARVPSPPRRAVDPTELFLRHLFRRVTHATLVGATVLPASACFEPMDGRPEAHADGGSQLASETATEPRLAGACAAYPQPLLADDIRAGGETDYLAIRSRPAAALPVAGASPAFHVLSEVGEPCAGATSDGCSRQLEQPPAACAPRPGMPCSQTYVVTTQGDEVVEFAGASRLRELFGDIDTPTEARLWVDAHATDGSCGARRTADGRLLVYVQTSTPEGCGLVTTLFREFEVAPNGTLGVRRSERSSGGGLDSSTGGSGGCTVAGRLPARLWSRPRPPSSSTLGDYLARCAHLEDASVLAFEQLARDLFRLGAPEALVRRALDAAQDERGHAATVAALAEARGGTCVAAGVGPVPARSLEEVAIENAVEGCVRETFGVLIGAHQALHASDRELADAMVGIVRDETRHAALSWDVHRWASSRLAPAARERVARAQDAAVAMLAQQVQDAVDPRLVRETGTPQPPVQRAMLQQLCASLWPNHLVA